jgi:acetyltransferase-like isoleucine patch superfamily enzyme
MLNLLRSNPHGRKWLASLSYRFRNPRRVVVGQDNQIQIQTEGNIPLLSNVMFKVYGNQNQIVIHPGVRLSNTKIEIHGDRNQVSLHADCRITGSYLWVEDHDCKLSIGARTVLEKEVKICVTEPQSEIAIGADCLFAYGTMIRSGDSHSIVDLEMNQRINYAESVRIDDHVWVGSNAQILKGVQIGSHSIVAAGAIVTKSIPENSLVVGVPARVQRSQVTWLREKLPKTTMS